MPDWTVDPGTGRTNASSQFNHLVKEVEALIRGEAHSLIGGRADMTATLIVAQLAHKWNVGPYDRPIEVEDDIERVEHLTAESGVPSVPALEATARELGIKWRELVDLASDRCYDGQTYAWIDGYLTAKLGARSGG